MFEEVDTIASSFLTGRASTRRQGEKLQLVIDGIPQAPVPLGREQEFSVRLPDFVFDGSEHLIQAKVAGRREWLNNCPLRFQSNYQGYVHMEPFAGPLLTGWAIDLSRP